MSRSEPRLRLGDDAEQIGDGLGNLVVALLDIVRQVLERQALRRVDSGDLGDEQVERLGQALQALEEKFAELRETFGSDADTLRLPVDLDELISDIDKPIRKDANS
jgi:hypothetical protein